MKSVNYAKGSPSAKRRDSQSEWLPFQGRILEQLAELQRKVDESLEQGRQNGEEIRMLRKELGLDGPHGRIPLVEAAVQTLLERVSTLERLRIESDGKKKLVTGALALLSGGAGGALIALIGRLLWAR